MADFSYLSGFSDPPDVDRNIPNRFYPVAWGDVAKAEERIGFRFPPQLRCFFQQVGSGFFGAAEGCKEVAVADHVNRILNPIEISDLMMGESQLAPEEGFDEGEMPFFEVGDGSFLIMKPVSENPDAVYWSYGPMVSLSLGEFVSELYYRDPLFYLALG